MSRKRDNSAGFGFSEQRFMELLSDLLGVQPMGELGRETPLDFSSLEAARNTVLLSELFSKYDDGKPSEKKEATTWERFHDAESTCRETNAKVFETFQHDPFWVNVRRRIWDLLGVFSWDECATDFRFGPGGTTRLPHAKRFAAYKYSGQPESTLGNAGLATCAIRMFPLWNQSVLLSGGTPEQLVKVVRGNSVITVPKNYKTHRTIAKEPCMNVYVQLGIGAAIRRRLKRNGVDLNDQTINQQRALQGSIAGLLATVDLSMASDSLAYEVVSWLLPNDWWYALEQCRSPVGVLPSGEVIHYQKFSSMGNGYTFELESLIFWAIAQQVCRPNVNERETLATVYGDDIILPSQFCGDLFVRLREAGFTPNPKKTHAEGCYRESCGKHYFQGADVSPFYIRKKVDRLDRLFLLHNNLYRWLAVAGIDGTDLLKGLRRFAPASWRKPRLPDGFGDGAFIGAVDELRLDSHLKGWEGWQVKALVRMSCDLGPELPDGQLMASLKAVSTRRDSDPLGGHRLTPGLSAVALERWCLEFSYGFDESMSGLPAKEGPYEEIDIFIPRYPAA